MEGALHAGQLPGSECLLLPHPWVEATGDHCQTESLVSTWDPVAKAPGLATWWAGAAALAMGLLAAPLCWAPETPGTH